MPLVCMRYELNTIGKGRNTAFFFCLKSLRRRVNDLLEALLSTAPIRHPLGYGQIPAKRGSNKTLHPSGETERGASRPAALGYNDTADALRRHVDNEDKQILKTGETPVLNVPNRGPA